MLALFRDLGYPEISPLPEGPPRPLWSVMVPTYHCARLLKETLESVLGQDPGPAVMQIEVIDDASTKDDPQAVVGELGRGRVDFFRQPRNVGLPENFNTCLRRSRGRLLHVLHGDDLVLPGFYARMGALFEQHPEAGSAHSRFVTCDEDGLWTRANEIMQRSAGDYPRALETLATRNWSQFAAVVLRRTVVEAVGGFHPSLAHAADWDMWRRAALHQAVAFEPAVLACYRVFDGNHSSGLFRSGENIADLRRAIDLGERYLPADRKAGWTAEARSNYAGLAIHLAGVMQGQGDAEGVRRQLHQAALTDPSALNARRARALRRWLVEQKLRGWFRRGIPSIASVGVGPRP